MTQGRYLKVTAIPSRTDFVNAETTALNLISLSILLSQNGSARPVRGQKVSCTVSYFGKLTS